MLGAIRAGRRAARRIGLTLGGPRLPSVDRQPPKTQRCFGRPLRCLKGIPPLGEAHADERATFFNRER